MIEIRNLTKSLFGGGHRVDVLNGVNLTVPAGQFLAVTGSSGSGKTTLLSLIAGLDTVTSGSIWIDRQDITQLNEDQLALLRSKSFGFVFQNFHLIPTLTALENVILACELSGGENSLEKARYALHQVMLQDRHTHYPAQLSGGEQQRLSLARAFINAPDIVLADEPTGNLDSKNTDRIMELLLNLHHTRKATVIIVTHEQQLAEMTQRILILNDGKIADDIQTSPSKS